MEITIKRIKYIYIDPVAKCQLTDTKDGHDSKEYTSFQASALLFNDLSHAPQAIVIGSGIGGLYLAALLAKSGRVVLVLEQWPGL